MNCPYERRPNTFTAIANIAAINQFRGERSMFATCKLSDDEILDEIETINKTGRTSNGWHCYGERTYRKPNGNPRGYWKVLNLIAATETGLKRREVCEKIGVKNLNLQLRALEWAGLIELDRDYTHKFKVTDFGKAYIAAVHCEFNAI